MSAVRLEGISCRFGPTTVVDRIDLHVREGEFVSLLGASGCGKTTTLRMIAGLQENSAGRIVIGDRVVSDAANGTYVVPEGRRLGMVFQSYAIWPHMTVFENVAYPLEVRRTPKAEISQRVMKALELVELGAFAHRPAPALSGGQQQRVAIARALVFEPGVLLLDEPLSNLDARLRDQMGAEFRALQQKLNITAIYVTHDQQEAMMLSDRVVMMKGGKILQVSTPEVIYDSPNCRSVADFFGNPNLLAGSVVAVREQVDDSATVEVKTELGWQGVARGGAGLAVGDRVLLVVRPEALELSRRAEVFATMDESGFPGLISTVRFHGAYRSLDIAVGTQKLNAVVPSTQRFEAGDEVLCRVVAGRSWALAETS